MKLALSDLIIQIVSRKVTIDDRRSTDTVSDLFNGVCRFAASTRKQAMNQLLVIISGDPAVADMEIN